VPLDIEEPESDALPTPELLPEVRTS
jgi:hypothetical protein